MGFACLGRETMVGIVFGVYPFIDVAGSFLIFLASLTVFGVLISDIALAFLDPRIRLQGGATK